MHDVQMMHVYIFLILISSYFWCDRPWQHIGKDWSILRCRLCFIVSWLLFFLSIFVVIWQSIGKSLIHFRICFFELNLVVFRLLYQKMFKHKTVLPSKQLCSFQSTVQWLQYTNSPLHSALLFFKQESENVKSWTFEKIYGSNEQLVWV